MFLSTPTLRPFVQNENPDNTGFKKPGASKPGGLSIRTPFKDRSVNSVSPTSKYNAKLHIQKKLEQASVKNVKSVKPMNLQQKEEVDDFYMNDYASSREVEDTFGDIFPSKRIDIVKFLRDYVSGGASPKYISDDEDDEPFELPIPDQITSCFPPLTPIQTYDVPLPVFNY